MECYEYIAPYVDDLCIAAQDPGKIIPALKEYYKLKVKVDGPLSQHLGADYTNQRSILTGYLNPTNLCSSKIHLKT